MAEKNLNDAIIMVRKGEADPASVTYVPKLATVTPVDLVSQLTAQKPVELQTLEVLQSIDKSLRFLVERAATQDAKVNTPTRNENQGKRK